MNATVAGTRKVLIVDDAPDLRLVLRIAIGRDTRFEVVGESSNGEEAIADAARTQPDVVVLDQMMPVLTGLEALPAIKESAPSARVVLYSAITEHIASLDLDVRPDAYVAKGTDLAGLLAAIAGDETSRAAVTTPA